MSPVIDDALKEGTRGSPNVTEQMFLVLHRKTDATTGWSLVVGWSIAACRQLFSFSWFNLTQAVRACRKQQKKTGRVQKNLLKTTEHASEGTSQRYRVV